MKQKSEPKAVMAPRFAGLNDDQLHQQMVAARDELYNRCIEVESYTKGELLPLCEEIIARYKQQGRKCRLNGKPTVENYFKSINLNYNTVRVWIHRKKLQTAMFQLTDGSKFSSRGGDKTPKLSAASRRALIEGCWVLNEVVEAHKAGQPIDSLVTKAQNVINKKRLDDIVNAHNAEPDYRTLLSVLLEVIEQNGQHLPVAVTDAVRKITMALNTGKISTPQPKKTPKTVANEMSIAATANGSVPPAPAFHTTEQSESGEEGMASELSGDEVDIATPTTDDNGGSTFVVRSYLDEFAIFKRGEKQPYEIHATSEEAEAHAAQLERGCRDQSACSEQRGGRNCSGDGCGE